MKKLVLFLITGMFLISFTSIAAKKTAMEKTLDGTYVKSTNTFTYKKDNLVFRDKFISYQIDDQSGRLEDIYKFMYSTYGVTDTDTIGLKIVGKEKADGIFEVTKIQNYRIPTEKLQ